MKRVASLVTAALVAALSAGAAMAKTNPESCDDPLKSKLGQRFCYQAFKDLTPVNYSSGYNVSFQYEAEKLTGKTDREADREMSFAYLFDSAKGSPVWGVKGDSTEHGRNTYSFIAQAGGAGGIAFALLGLYPKSFDVAIQHIQVTAVPEPATSALLLAGLGAIVFVSRRRRQAR
jgi:PEP-CTERM motif